MAQYIYEELEKNFVRIFDNNNQQESLKKTLSVKNDQLFAGEYNVDTPMNTTILTDYAKSR